MRVFISQPMRNKTQEEIETRRAEIIKAINNKYLNEHIEFIYSIIEQNPVDTTYIPVWYLGESIKKLSNATIAYFDKGWEMARGCQIEYNVCKAYNIPTISWREIERR